MTATHRRKLRMLFKAALLICLPLTGFVWALPSDGSFLSAAAILTLISVAVGVGAEFMASSTESELQEETVRLLAGQKQRADELAVRDEKLRQFDRVVQLLTEQNHNLRARLLSAHADIQRRRDAAAEEAGAFEELLPQRRSAFGSRGL